MHWTVPISKCGNNLQETGTCMHLSECAHVCMSVGGVYLKFLIPRAFSSSIWWSISLTSLLIRHNGKNSTTLQKYIIFILLLFGFQSSKKTVLFWTFWSLIFFRETWSVHTFIKLVWERPPPPFFCRRKKPVSL